MKDLWKLDTGSEAMPIPPEEIIDAHCDNLNARTEGRVRAKIAAWDGPTASYTRHEGISLALLAFSSIGSPKKVDIQEELGDVGESHFAFEFYLTSPSTPNYKFRILFLVYRIGYYPLQLVMDDEIASEIGVGQNVTCENEDEFNQYLEKILSSPKVAKVVTSLNHLALREEQKKQAV